MRRILQPTYSIEVPEEWEMISSEKSISIHAAHGSGAITITSYSTSPDSRSKSAEEVLREFSATDTEIHSATHNGLSTAETEYQEISEESRRYIYVRTMTGENQLIICSYNCQLDSFDLRELEIAKKIIDTIKPRR